jgi:hypothetical protein
MSFPMSGTKIALIIGDTSKIQGPTGGPYSSTQRFSAWHWAVLIGPPRTHPNAAADPHT